MVYMWEFRERKFGYIGEWVFPQKESRSLTDVSCFHPWNSHMYTMDHQKCV